MKVTILGCGGSAGLPMVGVADRSGYAGIWGCCDPENPKNRRTRSSIVIEQDGFRLLVDSGPDFREQMLCSGFSAVDAVIYTHVHSDHVAGLDELRAVNRVIGRPLPLLAKEEVIDELKKRFSYVFRPWEGGIFYRTSFEVRPLDTDFRAEDVSGGLFRQDITIGPLHGCVFDQKHGKITSLGMRFGDFAYSTDVDTLSEEAFEILQGLDTWVVGCFQYGPHSSHAWLERVLEWRERLAPRRLILTHMGPDMDYETLCRQLPEDTRPAWDGMVLDV